MKRAFLGWLAGFLAHWAFYDVIQRWSSTSDLYSYVCGVLLLRAVFAHQSKDLDAIHAFDQAAGAIGAGVVSARLTRRVIRGK